MCLGANIETVVFFIQQKNGNLWDKIVMSLVNKLLDNINILWYIMIKNYIRIKLCSNILLICIIISEDSLLKKNKEIWRNSRRVFHVPLRFQVGELTFEMLFLIKLGI